MTLPLSVSGQQFIIGRRVTDGETALPSLRAANGKLTGYHFYPTSREGAAAAVRTTDQAFPVYSQTTPDVRARFLNTLAGELDLLGKDFFTIAHQETTLPLARLQGKRTCTSSQLRIFAGVLRRGDAFGVRIDTTLPDRRSLPRPNLRQYLATLGPVAMFGTSNFPLAFSATGGDTTSALATGCPVVVKAHPGHMVTAELTVQAVVRAIAASGLPAGVFNMVFGTGIGADLVRHPAIQAVGFTGPLRDSKTLWQLAQQHPQPIPIFAEMSAINPLVILPQAVTIRAETLANGLVSSFTLGCEQSCTKPELILVLHDRDMSHFTQTLKVAIDQAPTQIMLNAPTLAYYEEGVSALEAHPHIRRLAGSDELVIGRAQARLYQAPASPLLAQDPLLQQEVFGPLAVLIEMTDEAELQFILHAIPGQLTATVHTESDDGSLAQRLLPVLIEKTGRVLFNGYPAGIGVYGTMVCGGPWPTTTGARGTSVGTQSIDRFLRPVCLQSVPVALLPPVVQDDNPLNLLRLINRQWTRETISPSVN